MLGALRLVSVCGSRATTARATARAIAASALPATATPRRFASTSPARSDEAEHATLNGFNFTVPKPRQRATTAEDEAAMEQRRVVSLQHLVDALKNMASPELATGSRVKLRGVTNDGISKRSDLEASDVNTLPIVTHGSAAASASKAKAARAAVPLADTPEEIAAEAASAAAAAVAINTAASNSVIVDFSRLNLPRLTFESAWDSLPKLFTQQGLPQELNPWLDGVLSLKHSEFDSDDVSKMIILQLERMRLLAPSPPSHLGNTFVNLKQAALMLRPQVFELYRLFSNPWLQPSVRVLFDGAQGTGKSVALLSLAYLSSLEQQTLVMYIPDVHEWMIRPLVLMPSLSQPGQFNHVYEAQRILVNFEALYSEQLDTIPLSKRRVIGNLPPFTVDMTLNDLVSFGASVPEISVEILTAVLEELREAQGYKVVIAVDGINALFSKSTAADSKGKHIANDNLALVQLFRSLLEAKPERSNTLFAAALTASHLPSPSEPIFQQVMRLAEPVLSEPEDFLAPQLEMPTLPISVLREAPFHNLPQAARIVDGRSLLKITLPNFTDVEMVNMLKYYQLRGWLNKHIEPVSVRTMRTMTEGNPRRLWDAISHM
ncbi:hypothetical protein CAOG_01631 [Capsaspora owczarzaki ATCC 30864]|uniref:Small ribosomal subunit protein mS29 n=1 Tax=Capsaspora owczarzaki (strain ATCC 30864) TaxID=595528 RepID=A0A0D2VJW4_CAPO3|nr:hypothetical protein CAOG_01631 [Capsaspora owczarzaki ATCC 30864]KJE90297.1 hypothetical protein CAOG_001631 [Capsaspora owczarzaki ATCC 30864]|eukprot:XP_004364499.2 hypothetical protein CAOG_01631 [Capsaspora owczarzaki ATCC 30864]